jgi:hypothetical protein
MVITDSNADPKILSHFEKHGVEVVVVDACE